MKTMRKMLELQVCIALFWVLVVQVSLAAVVSTGNFSEDFNIIWSPDHVTTSPDGHERTIKLDYPSGSGFCSNQQFVYGQIDMKIKLAPRYSAGVVQSYYLTSTDDTTRDEIDFEFLGNVTNEPYILQTNVFTNGQGNREERIYLWFDPTADFHSYTFLWNIHQIVFKVDQIPIRVYKNYADHGVDYPSSRPQNLKGTIYDGSSWATRGGNDKVNWTYAPFIASYKDYTIDACVWNGDTKPCSVISDGNWWNKKNNKRLTRKDRENYEWVRKNYLVFDYCEKNGTLPKECSLPKW